MHEHVVNLGHIRGIKLIAEPAKTLVKDPGLKRTIRSDQTIHTQIELFASDEHGIVDVTRYDPNIVGLKVFEGRVQVGARDNFLKLVDFLQQEYSLSLGLVVRFDDPRGVGVLLELL